MNSYGQILKINPYGDEDNVLKIYLGEEDDIYRLHNVVSTPDTYTYVIWHCSDTPCNITFNVLGITEVVPSTTEWSKYVKTVEFTGDNNNIDIHPELNTTTYYYEGYLSKGEKDTSWSLAPEDIIAGFEQANTQYENTMTIAKQTSDKFNWIVKSGSDESNFVLTDRAIELVAKEINLSGLVTFKGLNSETQSKIEHANNVISDWASDAIVEGTTTINGGYIQTQTIKTDQLDVGEILAVNGTFLGIINAQEINADRITSGTITSNRLNVYGLRVLHSSTDLETFSIDERGNVTMRGSVESYNYVSGESGWSIKFDGDSEFNDVVVRGNVITRSGGIVNEKPLGTSKIPVFWAGSSYEEREYAPFIVYDDGTVKATQGEYSGVLTGSVNIGNINISDKNSNTGGDALLTITDGNNGIKRVELTDTETSSFAQDVVIKDNFKNTVLEMKQTGELISTGGLVIKGTTSTATILEDSITIGESKIYGYDSGMKLISQTVDIGEVDNKTDLTVYGEATIDGTLTLEDEVNFGDVIVCNILPNGINFDIK